MNDIVLSSLLNLFALFGAEKGLDKDGSLMLISVYLKRYLGVRNHQSYMSLYSDLRDYYDDVPGLDRQAIAKSVCDKLRDQIPAEQQQSMMLRLMEFCSADAGAFAPDEAVFRTVADSFGIDDSLYASFVRFIRGEAGGNVLTFSPADGAGVVKTLYVGETDTLYFTYVGDCEVRMDDIPVLDGIFLVWQQSGVLKSRDFGPYYYSSVMEMYGKSAGADSICFSGRDLEFRFRGSDNGLHGFSFDLHSGQLVAIMGGSGVGKSTLLSILTGDLKPQSGSVTVGGRDIADPEVKALIGFVPQDDLLIGELTVYQNLRYTAELCFSGLSDEELDAKVCSVLAQLGLLASKDLKVGSPIDKCISGGQRKRLNIALELIREPAVLFLDEPTSGLSSADTEKVINLLKEQCCKGRLVVANIHQPSSDVYKLFDRLWVLDKGGYPVYDGNPIEAISYFKEAAHHADAQSTTCPVCGNVNPETVLDIVDEKALDTSGQPTDERKVSPQEWHKMYLESRPAMAEPEQKAIPETDQKRPSALKQMLIFLRRNVSAKLTDLQYLLVTLLEAPVLAVICGLLTRFTPESGVYSVMDNKNLVSYMFMAVIVAIFLGMSGSAEEIIKDRALLKRERFLGLSYRSYIWSKIVFMAGVCLVQTLLFLVIGNAIMGIHGLFRVWWLILFVSALLSALIGLLLSQCLRSVVAIYISIPLLLIPQILLCGLVVKFDDLAPRSHTGNVPVVGDFIPSRWAYEALAVSNFTMGGFESEFYAEDKDKFTTLYMREAFLRELESQNETRRDETVRQGLEEDPAHLALLRSELPVLSGFCGLPQYDGDWSCEDVGQYLEQARTAISDLSNRATLAMDRKVGAYIRDNGKDALTALKRDTYNIQLENLVLGRNAERPYAVRGESIVPRSGYVFLTPRSRCGHAPFYSGVKVLGDSEIPTLWYNLCVLLLMCAAVGACLLTDCPGRFVRERHS